jgi:phage repressor protein C with HTH and peptisase S24 domain
MNSGDKNWFSALQLAKLGAARAIDFPRSDKSARAKAKRLGWKERQVECQGGKSGYMAEFMPPDDVLMQIYEFMLNNPYFIDTGKKGIPAKDYMEHATRILTTGSGKPAHAVTENIPHASALSDFVFVPKYDVKASAGHGSLIHSEQIVDHLAFKKSWIRLELGCAEKDLALITVKGDSMEPTLSPNDLILIDLRKNYVADNAVYVLQYDGALLVKRIQRLMNGSVIIKSDNPEYKVEELSADQAKKLNVLGVVVWYGRKM